MDRKEVVKAIGEHFGVKPKYLGVPSCNYQIETEHETFIVDRVGQITNSEGREVEFEALVNGEFETLVNGEFETFIQEPVVEAITEVEVTVLMDGHTGQTLRNLVNLIYSKQTLLKKALNFKENIVNEEMVEAVNENKTETVSGFQIAIADIQNHGIEFNFQNEMITFNYFGLEGTPEKIQAYTQLAALLNQYAKTLKYASARAKDIDNEKFTFRVWLNRIGMIGDEYKETRKVLLQNLTGNSAFRYGKPEKETSGE